jgi:hypothetical protein
LNGASSRAGADQLRSLLGPDTVSANVDPSRTDDIVVAIATHNGGVAVAGQRNGVALNSGPNRAGADQLVALLRPDAVAAGEDPRRACQRVVERPAHDGGVAVGGQRNGLALLDALRAGSNRAGADQLAALLSPDTVAAGVDPCRTDGRCRR